MALRDLSALRNALLAGYNLQSFDKDTVLPSGFPQIIPSIGSSKVNYNKYTFSIVSASGLYIYFPNQLWFVANKFVELYNELIAYHDKLLQVFGSNKNTSAWQNVKNAKNADPSAPAYIFVENALKELADPTDEALLLKFITDYNWWGGGKGLERTQNDYYVSPIMSAAGLVNDSQGLLSTMCVVLAQNPSASKLLTDFINGSTCGDHSSLQQIFYGAPGTGKSFQIDRDTNEDNRIRTTFHPDYDYATFVGCYKPTMEEAEVRVVPVVLDNGTSFNQNNGTYKENKIVYRFVPQSFTKAYVEAWRRFANSECADKNYYLVIEEINRGNCAQIFGDLFQLLDRTRNGYSSYAVETDTDLQQFLTSDEEWKLNITLTEDIKNDEGHVIAKAKDVMSGKVLVLPPNLHIWATMNTSDQSLFPIDSAFKRRWDWKYVPIKYDNKDWKVVLEDGSWCLWTVLQQTLNDLIYDATESEDKMLGDWFVKTNDKNEISEEQLVGKIIFYLWNDVAKVDAGKLFDLDVEKHGRTRKVIFSDFYKIDGSVDNDVLKKWLREIRIDLMDKNSDSEDFTESLSSEDNSRNHYKLNNGASESLKDIANHVVRNFANNNPTMNAQQIRDLFVDAYKECRISHIVETDAEYKLREGQSSWERSASTVTLPNGEVLHVSTQFRAKKEGDNFFNFIKVTKERGWGEITE